MDKKQHESAVNSSLRTAAVSSSTRRSLQKSLCSSSSSSSFVRAVCAGLFVRVSSPAFSADNGLSLSRLQARTKKLRLQFAHGNGKKEKLVRFLVSRSCLCPFLSRSTVSRSRLFYLADDELISFFFFFPPACGCFCSRVLGTL